MVADKEEVFQELSDLARATTDDPGMKNTGVKGRTYDMQGRLLLGPIGAACALEVP